MIASLQSFIRNSAGRDFAFIAATLVVAAMMVVPVRPGMLDVLIAVNILAGFALVVFVALAARTGDLLTFPVVLLVTTVFRLALSVATSRAILTNGQAGEIVHGFGSLVIRNNITAGLVVFFVVAIVQFIVVTKGAERIAEVAARFALDAMPGRQMSIEADVKAGDMSRQDAKLARDALRKENNLLGAMDGAMRFVKGDSIATMVMIFVNLLGGAIIGTMQKGLGFGDAIGRYAILSVGDALVAQVPSLLSAVAAGILLSSVSSAGSQAVGSSIIQELARDKRMFGALGAAALALTLFPGFPAPVSLGLGALLLLPLIVAEIKRKAAAKDTSSGEDDYAATTNLGEPQQLLHATVYDPYVFAGHPSDLNRLERDGLANLMTETITRVVAEIGFPCPIFGIRADPGLPAGEIRIEIEGVHIRTVKLPSEDAAPYVASELGRAIAVEYPRRLHADDVTDWVKKMEPRYPSLAAEAMKHEKAQVAALMRKLLLGGVSLAYGRPILEELVATPSLEGDDMAQVERRIRQRLSTQIATRQCDATGTLHALHLDEAAIALLEAQAEVSPAVSDIIAADEELRRLAADIRGWRAAHADLEKVCMVVPENIRGFAATLVQDAAIDLPVLSTLEAAAAKSMKVHAKLGLSAGEQSIGRFNH
ncbi:hypothetical protein SLNSH_14630 [Alsobacter soli]|uniref:EscV/YscV/HrcV family type III secretion system export apparatus protein n=2 Tax=Alsobacter soli TaxID=2109933 RepID=A0A2T1HRG0_9HYPH|nr:hypothetical protein SLNSH_14630 [Alsobacter soli]